MIFLKVCTYLDSRRTKKRNITLTNAYCIEQGGGGAGAGDLGVPLATQSFC